MSGGEFWPGPISSDRTKFERVDTTDPYNLSVKIDPGYGIPKVGKKRIITLLNQPDRAVVIPMGGVREVVV